MKKKKKILLFLLMFLVSSSSISLFSQKSQIKPTRQSSLEAFSEGKWELAYSQFNELLLIYSKDPLYKYYSGVCLVNMGKDPEEAVKRLQEAIQSTAVIKTLPTDALFYLGRAQHMAGFYDKAINSFDLYTDHVGKKVAREQRVPFYIQQCSEEVGEVEKTGAVSVPDTKRDSIVVSGNITDTELKVSPGSEPLIPAYEGILERALDEQYVADSIYKQASIKTKVLDTVPYSRKTVLRAEISETKLLADSLQRSADKSFKEAELIINPQHDTIKPAAIIAAAGKNTGADAGHLATVPVIMDSIRQNPDNIKTTIPVVSKPVDIFSYFQILPKPVTDKNEKIEIDPEVQEGLIYRIQIAVFRNPVAPVYFKGITPVYGFKIPGTDNKYYYAGMFRRYNDASKALTGVKSKGFNDAFVVALLAGKQISADRAAVLEKEWGKKPFEGAIDEIALVQVDTIPSTLTFRVEVFRSAKPLKEDIISGIKTLSGNRGMDIISLEEGKIVYLIGKFITFESASEYADLLVRNGYREARVVAWLGKKEIPVDTARQLFETIE